MSASPLRICIVYDRLYPASIGGAERWYRLLAERLASAGHDVTYLTSRHWMSDEPPDIPGVRIVTVCSTDKLYDERRRRYGPVLRFALASWNHLLRHGSRYDVVQGSAMASLVGLGAVAISYLRAYRLVLDWWEVWSAAYWLTYAGQLPGAVGWLLHWILAHTRHHPVAHSQLHAERLRHLTPGRVMPAVERGLLAASAGSPEPLPAESHVLYLGRLIPEKQVPSIPPAIALARTRLPDLRASFFGEGPDAPFVRGAILSSGTERIIAMPGFVSESEVEVALQRSLCLILLSRREGYGLVVAEAAAHGVPSVVLRHPDSAATELVVDGVNGFVCDSSDPGEVASAILRIHDAGYRLRQSTLDWSRDNESELTIGGTLPRLLAIYQVERTSDESAG